MVMMFNTGVFSGTVLESTARYCKYRELVGIPAPLPESVVNAVHVASGTGVFPWRTLITREVPAGVSLVHVAVPQFTDAPASNTLERKAAEAA